MALFRFPSLFSSFSCSYSSSFLFSFDWIFVLVYIVCLCVGVDWKLSDVWQSWCSCEHMWMKILSMYGVMWMCFYCLFIPYIITLVSVCFPHLNVCTRLLHRRTNHFFYYRNPKICPSHVYCNIVTILVLMRRWETKLSNYSIYYAGNLQVL